MKKIIIGILIGIFIAFMVNLTFINTKKYLFNNKTNIQITKVVKRALLNVFPKVEIKEIMIEPSEDYVNFVNDELYKVEILYNKEDVFKKIIFNVGLYKSEFIIPSELELLELDKNAKPLYKN